MPIPTIPAPLPSGGPPSFDCAKHSGPDEMAICRSGRLSGLDRELNAAFVTLRSRLDPSSQLRLRDEQRLWLRQRATCRDNESCLISVYETRITELQNWR